VSIPLGGFHFDVGFRTQEAEQAAARLRQVWEQSAQAIRQSLSGVQVAPQGAQAAAASIGQVAAAARAARTATEGGINVTVRANGAQAALGQVTRIGDEARRLSGEAVQIRIDADAARSVAEIRGVQRALDGLKEGDRANIVLRVSAQQGVAAARQLERAIGQATERGAKIALTIDAAGAARDAARAAQLLQREVEQGLAGARRAQEAADRDAVRSTQAAARERVAAEQAAAREIERIEQARARVRVQAQQQAASSARAAFDAQPLLGPQQVPEGRVGATVNADAASVASGQLERLSETARRITGQPLQLTISANAAQAEQELERLRGRIAAARTGDNLTFAFRGNGRQLDDLLRKLEGDIARARSAGANIAFNLDTSQATRAVQEFQRIAQGALRGIVAGSGASGGLILGAGVGAGAIAALGTAVAFQQLTQAFVGAVAGGVRLNATMEQSKATFTTLTGSVELSGVALSKLRQYADITPFNDEEVIRSGQVFISVTGGSIAQMEKLVALSGRLAATNMNPELGGGMEGATTAIREALAGQFESIVNRFNVSRAVIAQARAEGLSGMALIERLLQSVGASEERVAALGQTFNGRLSTFVAGINRLKEALTGPIFDVLGKGLAEANAELEKNGTSWQEVARSVGQATAQMASAAVEAGKLLGALLQLSQAAPGVGAGALLGTAPRAIQIGRAMAGLPTLNPFELTHEQRQQFLVEGGFVAPPARPAAPAQAGAALTPQLQAIEQARTGAFNTNQQAEAQVGKQQAALKAIERQLHANAAAQALVNERYADALAPLQRQLLGLQGLQVRAQRAQLAAAEQQQGAQAPVEVRARAAYDTTIIDHEKELLEIRQRRAEIAQQLKDIESLAAERGAEAQIRASQRSLEAFRREIAERQAGRQRALEALREEARVDQESRQDSMRALQEYVRATQEARQIELEGIRERQQAEKQAREESLEGLREEIRARRDAVTEARDAERGRSEDAAPSRRASGSGSPPPRRPTGAPRTPSAGRRRPSGSSRRWRPPSASSSAPPASGRRPTTSPRPAPGGTCGSPASGSSSCRPSRRPSASRSSCRPAPRPSATPARRRLGGARRRWRRCRPAPRRPTAASSRRSRPATTPTPRSRPGCRPASARRTAPSTSASARRTAPSASRSRPTATPIDAPRPSSRRRRRPTATRAARRTPRSERPRPPTARPSGPTRTPSARPSGPTTRRRGPRTSRCAPARRASSGCRSSWTPRGWPASRRPTTATPSRSETPRRSSSRRWPSASGCSWPRTRGGWPPPPRPRSGPTTTPPGSAT
jgi:hypothetical protein